MQSPICAVDFTNNTSRSGWACPDLSNLLTINLKNKSFNNSVEWSCLYFQVYIPPWLAKVLKFAVFRLFEHAFVKLFHPWHDWPLIPYLQQHPHKFVPRNLFPIGYGKLLQKAICNEKPLEESPSILYGVMTPCPCFTGKSSLSQDLRWNGLKCVKTLNLAKRAVWQKGSVDWGIM